MPENNHTQRGDEVNDSEWADPPPDVGALMDDMTRRAENRIANDVSEHDGEGGDACGDVTE